MIIQPTLLRTPVLNYADEFQRMGVEVLTGIKWKTAVQLIDRQAGLTRTYREDLAKDAEVGKLSMRKLEVHLAARFAKDNIQNYAAVLLDGSESAEISPNFEWPLAKTQLVIFAEAFGEDVADNFIHGEWSEGNDSPLGLYDGVNTQVNRDITAGDISKKNGNLIEVGPLAAPADETDTSAYDNFMAAYNALHPALKKHRELICLCSSETETNIRLAQNNKYKGSAMLQKADMNAGMPIVEAPNCKLVSTYMVGTGDRLMFYLPGTLQFGVDDQSNASFVRVSQDVQDGNIVHLQMQEKVGCRVKDVRPRVFAVSTGSWYPAMVGGDYAPASSITGVAKGGSTQGSVAVKNEAGETITSLKRGETAVLTATPASSKTFVKWHDGLTTATRTVVGTGAPMVFEAEFSA